jgi:hypothetical protein
MRDQGFTTLSLISLILFAAIEAISWVVGAYPRSWVTLRWTDRGSAVSETINVFEWNARGFQWARIDETSGPDSDRRSVDEVRTYLNGITPADQERVLRNVWFESYLVHSKYNDFRWGKGAYASHRSEVRFDYALAAFAALPCGWILILLARVLTHYFGRSRAGECRRCRYNLTSNVSGVCPECGTAIADQQKVTP